MATAALTRYTPEEYLALERRAEFRSEYIDGRIVAMTGGSRPHARIVRNLIREIDTRTMDGPCEAFSSDLRLKVGRSGRYVYPDVMVVCGEQQMEDDLHDTLLNPSLVIEVLSPHTEAYDRGEKFEHYRTIGTLMEYVLVAQDRVAIERFSRRGDFWVLAPVHPGGVLVLESIGCEIPVEAIYHRVQLSLDGSPGS